MGADRRGISRTALLETLKDTLYKPYITSPNINPDTVLQELDEIMSTFAKPGSDYISLADFVNIMTSD